MKRLKDFSKQRWTALALLAFVVLLIGSILIVPLLNQSMALSEEKNELIFRVQRYQRIISRKDEVFKNIEKIKADYQTQGYFSNQTTAALASADLQQVIKAAVTSADGTLTSTQVMPGKNEGEFTLIAVKVRMSGDIETLRSVLYRIETAVPLLVIDELDIRPERGVRNRKTRQLEPSNKLNVSFQVSSFMSKQS
ncbi:MAG: general secretion pathway protein GspM [Gammaproteobacteria bacterium HGW-Gammaproteobacteria-3]|jgi:general secretion pathway protein M|nr:MAG: general secretion pathway protein GspM [Gammaproteobacteria bacterium HGW-Gammaproteobacteria-3]